MVVCMHHSHDVWYKREHYPTEKERPRYWHFDDTRQAFSIEYATQKFANLHGRMSSSVQLLLHRDLTLLSQN